MRCHDPFVVDPAPLQRLFAEMPVLEAEDIICRVLEDIAQRLDNLQSLRMVGAFTDIHTPARRIAVVAEQIGLTAVAGAALHVVCSAEGQNAVALGATLARLERTFDMAVSHVWDFQNHVVH